MDARLEASIKAARDLTCENVDLRCQIAELAGALGAIEDMAEAGQAHTSSLELAEFAGGLIAANDDFKAIREAARAALARYPVLVGQDKGGDGGGEEVTE